MKRTEKNPGYGELSKITDNQIKKKVLELFNKEFNTKIKKTDILSIDRKNGEITIKFSLTYLTVDGKLCKIYL